MTTEPEAVPRPADLAVGERSVRPGVLLCLSAVAAVVGVVFATRPLPTLGPSARLVLMAVAGTGVVVLAVTRFTTFVLLLLAIRPSLDAFKAVTNGVAGVDLTAILGLLFIGTSIIWLGVGRSHGTKDRASPVELALAGLVVAAVISSAGAFEPARSLVETLRVATAFMMYAVVRRVLLEHPERLEAVVAAILASAAAPCAVALYQLATNSGPEIDGFRRVAGTAVHPNTLAMYLVVIVLVATALLVVPRSRAVPGLLLALGVASPILVATLMRGALLAATVGVVVIAVMTRHLLLLAYLVAAAAMALSFSTVGERFGDLDEPVRPSGATGNSLEWRLQYWEQTIPLVRESPMTGLGLGAVEAAAEEGKAPHSDPVRILVETGALGLVMYLAAAVRLARSTRHALDVTSVGVERGVAVAAVAVLAAAAVLSLAANVVSQVVVLWYVLAVAAAGSAIAERGARFSSLPMVDAGPEPAWRS